MHPPDPHRSTAPLTADRSLRSTLVSSALTVVAFGAAFLTAVTAATFVGGPPLVTASVALVVGFATALAVPIGVSALACRFLESLRRRGRWPATAPSERSKPLPGCG
ncbi:MULTISPECIES: DUF677 domain-containing protein [Natrialbaceae]|uniref:DUF677 domain-containing protein n=1 Tax=Natrialbaceae TaxID=1644061 RepID=UPI00207C7832|nr:DUF677 domain-containing protein [Natronococcus sp. CG52]